jgi:signal transduction histidine kinase/CheY-like chemotaxis protein
VPLQEIINISGSCLKQDPEDRRLTFREILEAGNRLREKLDNLFSYSNILKEKNAGETGAEKKSAKAAVSVRYVRNGITGILIAASLIGLVLCLVMTSNWGSERISKEAARYESEVMLWMQQKKSILDMFSDVIAADPGVLDDYDSAVKWLDDIAKNYNEMTFAYMANPYNKEHAIIMNNGWVPDPDYKVEERQWYIDTERSGTGFSISAPYFDAQTGLYCITFSRSVYSEEGDFLGIFAIDCLMDKIVGVLDNSYTSDSFAFMVDRNGTIINHPHKEYEISTTNNVNIEDTEYADAYHRHSVFLMRDHDGRLAACYTKNNELSGFTVVVVQSWWSIYGTVLIVVMVFLLMLAVSAVGVVTMINRFIGWQDKTNEKLVEAAETAVAAEKAKSRFLAQMSHEIRTPINAVLGMNEMILRESSDASIREYAGNIHSAGKNLLGLINTILDFSKIEEGKMEIIPVKYDTAMFIENMINSISARAADKGLEFEAHIDSNLPSALYGDDMRVSQVAVNLLTNAVKYTREGRVDLYVDGVRRSDDSIGLRVRVKDTGIGIKPEDIGRMFESFTRLEENRNRTIEGTGLGMAIVNRLLDMMGSKLEVHSVYGEGSEFAFEVAQGIIDGQPIGDYEAKAREALSSEADDRYICAPGAKILVVDDNDMNLKVAKNLLKLSSIVPDTAASGAEALEKMKNSVYDIVMLDHMMPEMDGIETLHKARENALIPQDCTVIALTANAVVGARETYIEAGFDDYLSKPIEVKALENILGKYLPQDKLTDPDNTGPAAPADKADDASVLYGRLEEGGISTKTGLGYCADDDEFYKEMLQGFVDSAETRIRELNDALAANDMKTYAIKVHALKSTSRTIGAVGLSETAAELEKAANGGDEAAVRSGHALLLEKFGSAVSVIGAAGITAGVSVPDDGDEVMEFMPE